jgi:hypothetical protein
MNTGTMIAHALNAASATQGLSLQSLRQRLAAPRHRRDRQPPARSRIDEANEVREMARQLRHTDPAFAADLFAAADRHEITG